MSGGDFWSRRRAAVEAEARAEETAAQEAEVRAEETRLAERSDEEILAELDLPDPDTLESPEEVRAFLMAALPTRLRNRALRRLWRLNPVLANVDGLVDYGGDFTDSANVVENMQTAYRVGKGMWRAFAEEPAEVAANDDAAPEEPEETVVEEVLELPPAPVIDAAPPDPEPVMTASARRMRFDFETDT